MARVLSYLRIFTAHQVVTGLGMAAQSVTLSRFAAARGLDITREYVDIERRDGADSFDNRPQLSRAIDRALWLKIPILVAGLEILSRDIAFLGTLMQRQARFIVADAHDQTAPYALEPSGAPSASKRGNPELAAAREQAAAALRAQADTHAELVAPLIRQARAEGCTSLRKIADFLTVQGVETARGGVWSAKQVSNIMARLEAR